MRVAFVGGISLGHGPPQVERGDVHRLSGVDAVGGGGGWTRDPWEAAPSSPATLATAVASAYVATDAQFYVEGFAGYSWCFLYFALIC